MVDMIMKAFFQVWMEYVIKFAYGVMTIVWIMTLSFSFCFTSNYFVTNLDNSNIVTKSSINLIRSFRHNCRIVWGTFMALDPKTYPGISDQEIAMLPKPEKALYQYDRSWGRSQRNAIHLISLYTLELERHALGLFMTSNHIYANTLLSKIQWNHDFTRDPASESNKVK